MSYSSSDYSYSHDGDGQYTDAKGTDYGELGYYHVETTYYDNGNVTHTDTYIDNLYGSVDSSSYSESESGGK